MKRLTKQEAREVLQKYEPISYSAHERAVPALHEQHKHGKLCFTKRTRAGIIRDYTVMFLKEAFRGDPDIQILSKGGTTYFRFGESLKGKVKKLDRRHLARYHHTPTSKDYTSQGSNQGELFGTDYQLTNVHIGYILDDLGIGIREVVITCPVQNGRSNEWKFMIASSVKDTPEVDGIFNSYSEGGNGGYKLNPKAPKDQSKDARTGTGGSGADAD